MIDTSTKLGISGGKMNLDFYKTNVLPAIEELLSKAAGCEKIICTATAWARNISNLRKVQEITPIKINVISATEEPKLSLEAFIRTTSRDLSRYNYFVSVDSGKMSADIRVVNLRTGKEEGISLNIPPVTESEISKLKRKFEWLKDESNVLIALTGKRTAEATGYMTDEKQHDSEIDLSKLQWHKGYTAILEVLGENHTIVSNRTSSFYGSYFKELG